jgi:hypothetical protein
MVHSVGIEFSVKFYCAEATAAQEFVDVRNGRNHVAFGGKQYNGILHNHGSAAVSVELGLDNVWRRPLRKAFFVEGITELDSGAAHQRPFPPRIWSI